MTANDENTAGAGNSAELRDLRGFLTALYGDGPGVVHVSGGVGGYFNDDGKYSFTADDEHPDAGWRQLRYAWPGDAGKVAGDILAAAPTHDVYVCVSLMGGRRRRLTEAVNLRVLHADVDGGLDHAAVTALGGWAVRSGSPGHGQVYVELSEPVTFAQYDALERGLRDHFGADDKIAPNDVFRPVGSFNHKSRARGGDSTAVEWMIRPSGVRWEPAALAAALGVELPGPDAEAEALLGKSKRRRTSTGGAKTRTKARTTRASSRAAADPDPEVTECDLPTYPAVRDALNYHSDPADRSADTMRVVAACYDAGLTLAHARWLVGPRADLAERIDERHDDDVLRCWLKIDDDRAALHVDPVASDAAGPDADDTDNHKMPGQARFTDAGLAEIVAEKVLRGRFLKVRGIGWLRWTGTVWADCGDGPPTEALRLFVMRRIRFFARKLACEAANGNLIEAINSWKSVASHNRITSVLKLGGNLVEIDASMLDADADLLNTPVGVVDLRTGDVSAHDPACLMTKITRGSYRPGYTHPDVDKVLSALPVAERGWFQRRIGQAITGHMSADIALLQGSGENGKSALTTGGLFPALGTYAHTASSRLFSADKGHDHSTERADLRGRRLVIGEELTEGRSLDVTAIKRMTDVDYITARRLYQDNMTFRATHTLIVNTNHRPIIDQTDHGTWRRLVLLVFPYTFVKRDEDQVRDTDRLGDPTLKQRVTAGADGQHDALVTWAVQGAIAWYADPTAALRPTERVAADTWAWRTEADRILGYWTEWLTPDTGRCVLGTDMLDVFNRWLQENGHCPWATETFGPRFADHAETKRHGVEKRQTKKLEGLSRPPANYSRYQPHNPVPVRPWVWFGVRFRSREDDFGRGYGFGIVDPFSGGTEHVL